jgi:hypothetical protein
MPGRGPLLCDSESRSGPCRDCRRPMTNALEGHAVAWIHFCRGKVAAGEPSMPAGERTHLWRELAAFRLSRRATPLRLRRRSFRIAGSDQRQAGVGRQCEYEAAPRSSVAMPGPSRPRAAVSEARELTLAATSSRTLAPLNSAPSGHSALWCSPRTPLSRTCKTTLLCCGSTTAFTAGVESFQVDWSRRRPWDPRSSRYISPDCSSLPC